MIDWMSFRVPLSWIEPIDGGRIVRLHPDGSVDWDSPQRRTLEGSFASNLTVRSVEVGYVEVSGNPVKWHQGHNLWGTDDARGLLYDTMVKVASMVGVEPSADDLAAWLRGDAVLSRIDLTGMWALDSKADVLDWLRAADHLANVKWRGRGHYDPGTLTFGRAAQGQRAKAWQIVMYSKGTEISLPGHYLNPDLPHAEDLWGWAQDKLRIELRLRTAELKRLGLVSVSDWTPDRVSEVLARYVGKIEMAEQQTVEVDIELGLKNSHRVALAAWRSGADMRHVLSRTAFYRTRKELVGLTGIDIGFTNRASLNVVPLVRVLEAKPASVPEWGKVVTFVPSSRLSLAA